MAQFDFAIIGSGLSGLIHADMLLDQLAAGQSLVLLDPNPSGLAKKTFSSWRLKSAPPHRYSHLVVNSWDQFRVIGNDESVLAHSFGDYKYERISGERLLEHFNLRLDQDSRVTRIASAVTRVEIEEKDQALIELANNQILLAQNVLSSVIKTPERDVLQYFVGFEIEVDHDFFDPKTIDLMDFRVPQEESVRFVYVLPFSGSRALVEFTVFSTQKILDSECEKFLKEYVSKRLGLKEYRILSRETGVIPMSVEVAPLFAPRFGSALLQSIGGAAGRIKPCTGYSFQRNIQDLNTGTKRSLADFRFEIYDTLLLGIIKMDGGRGASIFYNLFNRNPPKRVLSFLDERTGIIEEIQIFWTLPWRPFILQLLMRYPFIFAVLLTLFLSHATGVWPEWFIPLVGLVTVGIGHGSVDHLLKPESERSSKFYLKYLSRIGIFLAFWQIFPHATLAFFLLQSADHFGEAQWFKALNFSKNHPFVKLAAFLWGLFAALFGVLFHWSQAVPILYKLIPDSPAIGTTTASHASVAAMVLLLSALGASWSLDQYEFRVSGSRRGGVASTLLLAACLMLLPLIQGFLCFFVFWHSWQSVLVQNNRQGWTISEHIRRALPFTLLSIVGALAVVWLTQEWRVLFILIGAITAAHAPVMSRFLRPT